MASESDMVYYGDKRFRVTKTGTIGSQRDTMLKNELHYLPQLGQSRTRGHQLPSNEFTYGTANVKLDGGVPEALSTWANLAKDSKTREERFQIVRDYISLNKEAAKNGCTTTKQNGQFRILNDITRKVKLGGGSAGSMERKQINFPEGHTFGMANRPTTPLGDVLGHKYLKDWLIEQERNECIKNEEKAEQSKVISGAYHTKASWLKNAKIPVEERPLWKMQRFRNVEACVDSFRTQKERSKAHSAHALDGIPRQGANVFNQGNYIVNTTSLPC